MAEDTPYDRVLYPDHPNSLTHPDRLAVMASLAGLEPAPADRCRVLEVGCGAGGNLIPLAWELPDSDFLGIDLAAQPVESGRRRIATLGLHNVELRHLDIMEFPADGGTFDYVIAHGFYSWVPAVVRDRLLALCRRHLAPHGVAFVSYSAYPGAYLRQMLRQMMLFHVDRETDPRARVAQARALAGFLADSGVPADEFGVWMKSEAERVRRYLPGHLYHDDLAPINDAVWFHEFVEQAVRHGLRYLGEANYHAPSEVLGLPAPVREVLAGLGEDLCLREQYIDFLKCRRFRMSLLCQGETRCIQSLVPQPVERLHVCSPARAVAGSLRLDDEEAVRFEGPAGEAILVSHPAAKAALTAAGEIWPGILPFAELHAEACRRIAPSWRAGSAEAIGGALCVALGADLAFLHACPPRYMLHPGERPMVSPYARMQAAEGEIVTTLRHGLAQVADPFARRIVQLLDGTRDRHALAAELRANGPDSAGVGAVDGGLETRIESVLSELARIPLLVG